MRQGLTSCVALVMTPLTKQPLVNSTCPVTRSLHFPLPAWLQAHCTVLWKAVPYGTCGTYASSDKTSSQPS